MQEEERNGLVRESLCEEAAFEQCLKEVGELSQEVSGEECSRPKGQPVKGPGVGPVPVPGWPVQWEASDSQDSPGGACHHFPIVEMRKLRLRAY